MTIQEYVERGRAAVEAIQEDVYKRQMNNRSEGGGGVPCPE